MEKAPSYQELMNPLLRALRSLGGSASIEELLQQVIDDEQYPVEVTEEIHSEERGLTKVAYNLAWVRTYLKNYGLITNSARGVWTLTPEGQSTNAVDPKTVTRAMQEKLREKQDSQIVDVEDPELDLEDEALVNWREVLMETLLKMKPDAFERLCQRVLRESGFTQVEVTGRSGDGGIDGNGVVRLAGILSFPVVFQCKRYQNSVSVGVVRDFRGAMIGRADKGLIITTAGFTNDARIEATRDGAPPIDLIDGEQFMDRLKNLDIGVSTRQVEVVEIDKKWFESI